jgi:hypothetical protein
LVVTDCSAVLETWQQSQRAARMEKPRPQPDRVGPGIQPAAPLPSRCRAAEDLRAPLPLADLLRDRFITLLAHGGDRLDCSAIGQLAANDANYPPNETSPEAP